MAKVHANGIEIYYEVRGAGPRLLFLNGSGATIADSAILVDVFAHDFEVAVLDQRGLGRTSVPPGPYTMAQYAADALAVMDDLGWSMCRVVGISFGGMVAQELAVTAPDRVERLGLVCTSAGGLGKPSYALHELAQLPVRERVATHTKLMDTRFNEAWLAEHPRDRVFVEFMQRGLVVEKTPERVRGEYEQLEARRYHDTFSRLHVIKCPTLVASGKFDGIAPPDNGRAIAEQIDGAMYAEYEGGHMFFAQDRAAFPDIINFLRGPDGP